MYSNNLLKSKINSIDYISSKELKKKIATSKTNIQQESKCIDNASLYNKLSQEYKYTYFNVKGKLINSQFKEIQSNPPRFNSKLILKENDNDESKHIIAIKRAKKETFNLLSNIEYNTLFYLTNLLTEIFPSETDPFESQAIFIVTPLTKIFYKTLKAYTPKVIKSRTVLMHSPIPLLSFDNKKRSKSIIKTLKQLSIRQLISIKRINDLSYKEILSAPVENIINKVRDNKALALEINTNTKIENIMGRVISINHINSRNGHDQYSLELMSMIDCNSIVIYLGKQYPRFLNANMIIHISSIGRKLTEKLSFIFHTHKSTCFRLIGNSSLVEMPKKDFDYLRSFQSLSSLLCLVTSNQIIRHHIYFIAKVKCIYRITGSLIKSNASSDKDIFETVTLKGKVLLEDGTAEAMCYIDDDVLVDTLSIHRDLLYRMVNRIKEKEYSVLYDKYDDDSFIQLDKINKAIFNERFFIGRPFCMLNSSQTSTIWNIERRLSMGWSRIEDELENLKNNSSFVNGMLCYLYDSTNKKTIGIKSCLLIEYSERIIENYG